MGAPAFGETLLEPCLDRGRDKPCDRSAVGHDDDPRHWFRGAGVAYHAMMVFAGPVSSTKRREPAQ
jgi:hypothetical protein